MPSTTACFSERERDTDLPPSSGSSLCSIYYTRPDVQEFKEPTRYCWATRPPCECQSFPNMRESPELQATACRIALVYLLANQPLPPPRSPASSPDTLPRNRE